MQPNPMLFLSSFSYILPCIVCYSVGQPALATLYGAVIVVSSSYHATKNSALLWLDVPLAHIAHLLSLAFIVKGGWWSMPAYFAWLVYALTAYYYGQRTQTLIWDPDVDRATPWHMGLHALTSLCTAYSVFVTAQVE